MFYEVTKGHYIILGCQFKVAGKKINIFSQLPQKTQDLLNRKFQYVFSRYVLMIRSERVQSLLANRDNNNTAKKLKAHWWPENHLAAQSLSSWEMLH